MLELPLLYLEILPIPNSCQQLISKCFLLGPLNSAKHTYLELQYPRTRMRLLIIPISPSRHNQQQSYTKRARLCEIRPYLRACKIRTPEASAATARSTPAACGAILPRSPHLGISNHEAAHLDPGPTSLIRITPLPVPIPQHVHVLDSPTPQLFAWPDEGRARQSGCDPTSAPVNIK